MLGRFSSAVRLAFSTAALAGALIGFCASPFAGALLLVFDQKPEAITRYRLQRLSTGALVSEIREAVAADEFSDAEDLVRIGRELGHQIPPDVIASTVEPMADAVWRNSTGFAQGFIHGEVNSMPSILGAVAADYLVFGDVRDTYREGSKFLVGRVRLFHTRSVVVRNCDARPWHWRVRCRSICPEEREQGAQAEQQAGNPPRPHSGRSH